MEDTVRNKHAAPCFHGGRVFESIGLDYSNMRLLETSYAADVLDAWYPPAPSVVEKLSQHLAWGIRTSPPPTNSNVIFAIADAYKLDPHTIVIGAGSSELIYRVLPNFIDQRGVLIPKPAYGEYEHIVRNIYGLPVYEMFTDQVAFKIDISRLLAQTKIHKPSAIVLINPSNPSGQNITRSELIELINQVDSSINLIVDETYSEYNSNIDSIADLCSTYRNLIIFKSLSKTFALSGLRAGFCVVHRTHAESLCSYTPPYIIPTLTQMALYESFKNIQYYQEQIKNTHESKQYFVGLLDKHAPMIKTIPSIINSVLLDVSATNIKASEYVERLAKARVYVRNIDSQGILDAGRYIRVSILSRTDMQIIAHKITEISCGVKIASSGIAHNVKELA